MSELPDFLKRPVEEYEELVEQLQAIMLELQRASQEYSAMEMSPDTMQYNALALKNLRLLKNTLEKAEACSNKSAEIDELFQKRVGANYPNAREITARVMSTQLKSMRIMAAYQALGSQQ